MDSTSSTPEFIELQPGQDIPQALSDIARLAEIEGRPFATSANGIALTINPGDSAEAVCARYDEARAAAQERFRNSPEGIAQKAEQEAKSKRAQECCDSFVAALRCASSQADIAALLPALADYIDAADRRGVQGHQQEVASLLLALGFSGEDSAGMDRESAAGFPRHVARQVINSVADYGLIHPVGARIIRDWLERQPVANGNE